MPDYDLGRAHGEVVITADTRQATRAIGEYDEATKGATESAKQQTRVEQELTERRRVATEAARRRKDAEAEYKRVMADSTATVEDQVRAEEERNKARGEHLQAARRSADAERAYRAEVVGNIDAVNKFVRSLGDSSSALDTHTNKMREMRREADNLSKSLTSLSRTMSTAVGGLAKGAAIGGGVGAAGGLAALVGAGGTQGLITGLAGVSAVISQFAGSLALLPGSIGGAVAVMGTLKVATDGVSEAFESFDDPKKLAESLKQLSPAARDVVLQFYSFRDAFKGAKQVIQEGLFAPLIGEIQPLVTTLLPVFMEGMRGIASAIGEAGAQFAQWARSKDTVAAFSAFLDNIQKGLRAMTPALVPILDAFKTLSVVGSQFFPQIADSIVKMANSFNQWIQTASQTGELQSWIQDGIDAFKQLWQIIKNVGIAFKNIFSLDGVDGSGILQMIANLSAKFREWTESVGGQNAITEFFAKMREASNNLMPILGKLFEIVGTVVNTFLDLGNDTSSGVLSLLTSISEAFKQLGPQLVAMAPAINEALKALGEAFLGIVVAIGPQLPGLMSTMAEVFKDLAPIAVKLAEALAAILEKLTPTEIEIILGLVVAFSALSTILPVVVGAISGLTVIAGVLGVSMLAAAGIIAGVVVAIGLLVAAGIWLYKNWDTVKEKAGQLWDKVKEFGAWIAETFSNIWKSLVETVTGAWASVTAAVSNAINNIKQFFTNMWTDALSWGRKIIDNLAQGIMDAVPGLRGVVDWVAKLFPDSWLTQSPAKRGPLSRTSPNEMGQKLVGNFAAGIESGTPAATSAADKAAGGAAASFTSAGVAGRSGQSAGKSGFEQWVSGITEDLSMWSRFFQDALKFGQDIASIFVDGAKIVASLWNNGDNPMTRPGGIAGPPKGEQVPGQPEVKGKAPIPELTPQGWLPEEEAAAANLPPQQQVPGVPSVTPDGTTTTGTPPANPPASTQGQAPPGAVGALPTGVRQLPGGGYSQVATQDQIASAIIAKGRAAGLNDEQIRGALITAAGESNVGMNVYGGDQGIGGAWGVYQQGNGYGAVSDRQDPNKAIDAFIGLYSQQLKAQPGLTPLQVATGVQQHGGPGSPGSWQNTAGDNWYLKANFGQTATATGNALFDRLSKSPAQTQGDAGAPIAAAGPTANGRLPLPGVGQPGLGGGPGAQAARRGGSTGLGGVRRVSQGAPGSYGLPAGSNSGGYGGKGVQFPQWVYDLGNAFGVEPSTYPDHQENGAGGSIASGPVDPNPKGLNRGIDWRPIGLSWSSPEGAARMEQFSTFLQQNGLAEQVIFRNAVTGKTVGYPLNSDYSDNYPEHENHSHTRFGRNLVFGDQGVPLPPQVKLTGGSSPLPSAPPPNPPPPNPSAGTPSATTTSTPNSDWMRLPAGWDPNTPIPNEVRRANGIPDSLPPMYYAAQPGSVTNVYDPAAPDANSMGVVSRPVEILPSVQGEPTGAAASTQTPLDQFSSAVGDASGVISDAFKVFDDVIANINATAQLTSRFVRGIENSEDIYKTVDDIQTFITTAADVAKLISSGTGLAAGLVGAGAAGDPSGGTAGAAAALQSVSAIAGLVSTALQATNAGIDLAQQGYRIVTKYGAMFAGGILGGPETGPLGGNVRMLLNTNNGEIYTYSEDNSQLKNTKNVPQWMSKAYGGTNQQPIQQTQVNLYTGPGADPKNLIADTMWLVNAGAPQTVSVAGKD